MRRPFIIRIDDVAVHDRPQDQLTYELCRAGLKVTCAVIPQALTAECADFLRFTARCFPGQLEVHQHGLSHVDYSSGAGERHEFGQRRTFAEQLADIQRGQRMLEDALGALFFPAFTPPFNTYDQNTLKALKQSGFRLVSAGKRDPSNHVLPAFAPEIDCFEWHPQREKTWVELEVALRHTAPGGPRGMMLYPNLTSLPLAQALGSKLPLTLREHETLTLAALCTPHFAFARDP